MGKDPRKGDHGLLFRKREEKASLRCVAFPIHVVTLVAASAKPTFLRIAPFRDVHIFSFPSMASALIFRQQCALSDAKCFAALVGSTSGKEGWNAMPLLSSFLYFLLAISSKLIFYLAQSSPCELLTCDACPALIPVEFRGRSSISPEMLELRRRRRRSRRFPLAVLHLEQRG